ncbi:MAG: GntR family transcriptional regulator [Thermodesulfobacteriota bacterium]
MVKQVITREPFNLQRETFVDKIVEIIENRILSGELQPKDKLSETTLAKEFHVSRGPAREALLRLEEMDLVQKSHAGRVVRGFSIEEFRENYELKLIIEAYCCMQGALKATTRDISKIQNLLDEIAKILHPKHTTRRKKLNNQFHDALVTCSNNKKLTEIYRLQTKKVYWGRFFTYDEPQRPEKSYKDHLEIFSAFVKKDGEKVRHLVEIHRREVMDIVSSKLQVLFHSESK